MFTHSEKTVKNKTLQQAINQAKGVLGVDVTERISLGDYGHQNLQTEMTVEELSNVVNYLVDINQMERYHAWGR